MNIVTFTELRSNLAKIMDAILDQCEPVAIRRPKGEHMVLLSLREYESLKETAYLLGSEANAKHLRKSLASLKAGKTTKKTLLDE